VPGRDVQILDDERPVAQASAARSACAPGRTALPARLEQPGGLRGDLRGEWFHIKDAAKQDDGYFWYAGEPTT
jgi:hypothetical protein